MMWNWQQINWPEFSYSASKLEAFEERFLIESAKLIGATSVITDEQKHQFSIDLMSEEALKSSKIEGELLNRDSVASSILRQLGLAPEYSDHRANDKEKGIAALMADNYHAFNKPLTDALMFQWHPCVVAGSWHVRNIGAYRTSKNPMQVVSEKNYNYTVHFEAPPSDSVPSEMKAFINWFNDTAPDGTRPLPALTRAGIAHLYFVSIHPFDDGNGRIGRALSEKALAQSLGRPALVALSHQIEHTRPEYYRQLEVTQKGLNIDPWLEYFARTTLDAVAYSQKMVRFIVEKTRLFDRVNGVINERQEKALVRMFAEGMNGFKGGLSADKYIKITGAPRATATRDLNKLLELNVFTKSGALRHTRYWLNLGEEFEEEMRKYLSEQSRPSK